MSPSTTIFMTARAIKLLESISNDCQFDKDRPEYLGYLNVSGDDFRDRDIVDTWEFICNYPLTFETVCLDQFGLYITGRGIRYEETVFYKK